MFERFRKPKPVRVEVVQPTTPAITIVDSLGRFVPASLVERVWIQPVNTASGVAGYNIKMHIGGTIVDEIVYETCPNLPMAQQSITTILGEL